MVLRMPIIHPPTDTRMIVVAGKIMWYSTLPI